LPDATLAAVVIAAVIELVDIPAIRRLYRVYAGPAASPLAVGARPDFVAALAALFGVLVFDTLPGLFIGIGVSFLLLLYRVSAPHVAILGKVPGTRSQYGDLSRHEENQAIEGVLVIRPDGGLFFANSDHIRQHILAEVERKNPRAVVVDGETMPFIDVTAVEMLNNLTDELGRRGVTLALARDVGDVRDVVRRAAGPEHAAHIYPTVQAAVDALREDDLAP
jgi:anti-anti-sigma factor